MNSIILANILSLIGEIVNTILPFLNTKKKMLIVQAINQLVFITVYYISGGYAMIVICTILIIRNLYSVFREPNSIVYIILLISGTIMSILANNNGLIGIIPIICFVTYTMGVWKTNNEQILRKILVFNLIFYAIFDGYLKIYVNTAFDVFNIFATIFAIYKYNKKEVTSNG